jgi:hypothetical protein
MNENMTQLDETKPGRRASSTPIVSAVRRDFGTTDAT